MSVDPTTAAGQTAQEVSRALDGPTSAVTVNRPPREVVRTLMVAMAAVLLMEAVIIGLIAWPSLWWLSELTALRRINALAVVAWLLCADIVLIVVAFATPIIGRVQATAQAGMVGGALGTGGK